MTASGALRTSGALWSSHGRGEPITLVVHGLGATKGEARIPASGLAGTRVVVTLPGHGDAADAPASYWNYERIAEDVLAVADEVGATRAVGVSLGAGVLTTLAAQRPDRFEKCALLLPAASDRSRDVRSASVLGDLAEAARDARGDDGVRLRALVAEGLPEGVAVGDYVDQRAEALARLGDALRTMAGQRPVADVSALASAVTRVLVVGAVGDPLHPSEVAERLAGAFADARLELLPSPAPMLTHRGDLRRLLTGFLDG